MRDIPHRRLIGVLGGMGPAATIDFMAKVLMLTPANIDQDHVPLLVHHVPQIPDRSAAIICGTDAPFLPMVAGLTKLERAGAQVLAIPCNTAHFWFDRLAAACSVPLLHIADTVSDMMSEMQPSPRVVGLMATASTIDAGLYQARLAAGPVRLMLPDAAIQDLVTRSIAAVKTGQHDLAHSLAGEAGQRLLDRGADHLLLACTELPLALVASPLLSLCIDSTKALAQACIRASFGDQHLWHPSLVGAV